MNSHWHHMMESLFNSKNWQQLDTEQLKRMTMEYPYFPITQFMYARKLKLDHHSAYPEQAAKTAIFFTNPYWLNWQMNLDKYVEEPREERIKAPEPAKQPIETPPVVEESVEIEEPVLESNPVEIIATETPIIDEELTESFVDEHERSHAQESETELINPDFESHVTPEIEAELSPPPQVHQPKVEIAAAPDESLIPIEPLFTTDYFASQGIKLSEAEETSDQLGQKLKSFTEWLKTMKRLQPKETQIAANDVADQKIQRIAETSNQSREILTETMAEVLLLQGLKDKAIEVYQKLSLLNPQKSAYFAAKIDEIKVV